MSVTAHYVKDTEATWRLQARLIAFKHMPGSHDGRSLGKAFVEVLRQHRLTRKVGQVTADNASNNNSMMEEVEKVLEEEGIQFSRWGNHIRYII
jgi:hypothetical protein